MSDIRSDKQGNMDNVNARHVMNDTKMILYLFFSLLFFSDVSFVFNKYGTQHGQLFTCCEALRGTHQ